MPAHDPICCPTFRERPRVINTLSGAKLPPRPHSLMLPAPHMDPRWPVVWGMLWASRGPVPLTQVQGAYTGVEGCAASSQALALQGGSNWAHAGGACRDLQPIGTASSKHARAAEATQPCSPSIHPIVTPSRARQDHTDEPHAHPPHGARPEPRCSPSGRLQPAINQPKASASKSLSTRQPSRMKCPSRMEPQQGKKHMRGAGKDFPPPPFPPRSLA